MNCTVPGGMSACWPDLTMTGNVIIDTRWNKGDGPLAGLYPQEITIQHGWRCRVCRHGKR
jgi:hypothetical protein